jgi:hypothetical protein
MKILIALAGLAAATALTSNAADAGWMSLFDGKTTAGWQEVTGLPFPTTSWTIEDGCLKAFPNPDGQQDIRTAAEFDSFEFQFDWKLLADGNSGVKYGIEKTDRWQRKGQKGFQARARGPEYQLVDNERGEAADPKRSCGALYGRIAPKPGAAKAAGEFNHSVLLVRGSHVEHWLNGVKVVEYDDAAPRRSPICLQNHGTPVWFRNLKVRRLD